MAIVELVEQRRGETGSCRCWPARRCAGAAAGAQKFAIHFDPSLVRPGAFYALRARIVADGAVLLETPYPQPISPLSGDQPTLALTAALALSGQCCRASRQEEKSGGQWRAAELNHSHRSPPL